MDVACRVAKTASDDDPPAERVEVTCSRCGLTTSSPGTSPAAIHRCLALLGRECWRRDRGEVNLYVAKETIDDEF